MDFAKRPYAEFIENVARGLFKMDPAAILVMAELPDGSMATCNWQIDVGVRQRMIGCLTQDQIVDVVRIRKNEIFGEDDDGQDD